nr:sigma-70 family RNA polymerase sigma factor [Armatimonas rosea]
MQVEERYQSLVASFDQDYRRLVRLCARLSGSSDAAEDIAQDTLIEAWRNRHKWTGTGSSFAWLSRIAVNVCWRWRRRRGRDSSRSVDAPDDILENTLIAPDWQAELEQGELLTLLDRALASLPASTRELLVAKYVDDTPLSELSSQLGATTGAIAVRLHRGRQALQNVLQSEFRDDAIAFGLIDPQTADWVDTKLWCADCGKAHLQALRTPQDIFQLRCPHCIAQTGRYFEAVDLTTRVVQRILGEARGFRTIQSRLDAAGFRYCQQSLEKGEVGCAYCGKPTRVVCLPPDAPNNPLPGEYALTMRCVHCPAPTLAISLGRLLLGAPEAQEFWRTTPRLRRVPELATTFEGTPAIRTRYESVMGSGALEIFSDQATFKLLRIRREPT